MLYVNEGCQEVVELFFIFSFQHLFMRLSTLPWLIAGILPTAALAQTFQYGSRFPKNKLYNLEPDTIGLDSIDGTVAAFGDFNGDKL